MVMAQYISFLIRLWTDESDGSQRWEVRHVQSGREIVVPDDEFGVTLWVEADATDVLRGSIKHVKSGESVQFQSGKRMLDFISGHLEAPPEGMGGNGGSKINELPDLTAHKTKPEGGPQP